MQSQHLTLRNPALVHVPELDGIRGLAILLVLIVHLYYRCRVTEIIVPASPLGQVLTFGWTGVELFFVLSGFLITHSVLRAAQENKGLASFYIRRFGRIVPLYLLLIFAIALCGAFNLNAKIKVISDSVTANLPVYLFFTSNLAEFWGINLQDADKALAPLWSVALEQQYYLLWPPLLYFLGAKNALRAGCVMLLLSPLSRAVFYNHFSRVIFYTFPLFHSDGLLIGSCAAILGSSTIIPKKWLFPCIVMSLLGIIILWDAEGGINYQNLVVQIFGFSIIPLFYSGIILLACSADVRLSFFRNNILKKFGKYSYSIYLIHFPLLLAISQFRLPLGVIWCNILLLGFILLNLVVGMCVWTLFERPVNLFFRRIAEKWDSEDN